MTPRHDGKVEEVDSPRQSDGPEQSGKSGDQGGYPQSRRQCVDDKPRTQTKHDDEPRLFSVYALCASTNRLSGPGAAESTRLAAVKAIQVEKSIMLPDFLRVRKYCRRD